jgi:putative Mg2+ transporter-C (MgtC) family protein
MDGWWAVAWMTVQEELFTIPDPASTTRLCIRSLLASLFGGLLGYERERHRTAAGLRTHMLVALGAALFVMVPLEGGVAIADMSRVLQGLTSGIGFLGAGAVIKLSQDRSIRGLTTAASIWLTAAIGVAAGMGMILAAAIATGLGLFILAQLHGWCRPKTNDTEVELG